MEARQAESNKKLENLRFALTEAHDESSARRAYEFETRKRLYTELDPLLFQLREQSESALFRIYGLAKSARTGKLLPEGSTKAANRLHGGSGSYLPSTRYRFMVPLATYRLCQQSLTAVDLSLDETLRRQYLLAKMLYRSWSDGDEIAEIAVDGRDRLLYDPDSKSPDLAVSMQQHLSVQKIERIIEALIVQQQPEEARRCVTLGEFFKAYESREPIFFGAVEPLRDLFVAFNPGSRPVLWRLIIVHAYLYAGLSGHAHTIESLESVFDDEDRRRLSWTDIAQSDNQHADEPHLTARTYLRTQIVWRSIISQPAPDTRR